MTPCGYRIKIKLICGLTKDRNQALILIFIIQEFLAWGGTFCYIKYFFIFENNIKVCMQNIQGSFSILSGFWRLKALRLSNMILHALVELYKYKEKLLLDWELYQEKF